MLYSDLRYPTISMCLLTPHSEIIDCQSAIERPYFFSIEGKYDAGPCFGQGGDCSGTIHASDRSIASSTVHLVLRGSIVGSVQKAS